MLHGSLADEGSWTLSGLLVPYEFEVDIGGHGCCKLLRCWSECGDEVRMTPRVVDSGDHLGNR